MSRTRTPTPELTLQYATGNPDTQYTIMMREYNVMLRKRKREEDSNDYDGFMPTSKKVKVEEEEEVDIQSFDEDVVIDVDDLAEVKQEELEIKLEEGEERVKEVKQEGDKKAEDNGEVDDDAYNRIIVSLTYEEIEQVSRDSIACYYAWGDGFFPSEEPLEDIVRRFVINLRKRP